MRSYPPQYQRSSTPLNLSPSLFPFLFCPPSHFCSLFRLFSLFFLVLLLSFSFSFLFPSLNHPSFVFSPFFLTLSADFFLVGVCVYLRVYVHAYSAILCVSANLEPYVFNRRRNIHSVQRLSWVFAAQERKKKRSFETGNHQVNAYFH